MTDTKYNGWTNYATWRVNLELFDGIDLNETFTILWWDDNNAQDLDTIKFNLSQDLEAYAEDIVFIDSSEGLARDYALAFLNEVDWYEIATHMVNNHITEQKYISEAA
jgi:hypothetical protein